MFHRRSAVAAFTGVIILAYGAGARGQSFNIAFGPPNVVPSPDYGAAGLPGTWNAMVAANGTTTFNLIDINGTVTDVRLTQVGGSATLSVNDPGTGSDDAALMDHFLVTYTPTLETCLFVNALDDGLYEAIIYAMMPAAANVVSYTSSDQEPGFPHEVVGGEWPGFHIEGVTYSRHYCVVGPPYPGRLWMHSGIVPGQNPASGAALNGVQIRKLPPIVPADMNCDGNLDGHDVDAFVDALMQPEAYHAGQPTCNILNGDMDGDWAISEDDIAEFVLALVEA